MPECGDVFPTLRKLKCHRGKAHGVRRTCELGSCAMPCVHIARSTPTAGRRAMAHLEKGARSCMEALMPLGGARGGGAQRRGSCELVRYRRQARVEGAYPDVGLLAVAT